MKVEKTERGFERIVLPANLTENGNKRLVQQSSSIGDYPDSFDRPGTSYLWIDEHHHLNREQVRELIAHLSAWCETGSLVATNKERGQS